MTYRPTTIEVIFTRPDGSQVLWETAEYGTDYGDMLMRNYSKLPGFFVRCV
jgi:hypothetical protein